MSDETSAYPNASEAYDIRGSVGEGAFAKVHHGVVLTGDHAGEQVAIKVIALENFSVTMDDIYDEVRTMMLCKHDNVLRLHAAFVVKSSLWLVMPLLDRGSCYHIMRTLHTTGFLHDGQGFPENAIAAILQQTLLALQYLHSHSQVHRDIKAGNILLDSTGNVKLADFGVAGWLDEPGRKEIGTRETFVGTPCWMAPEVMGQGAGYNQLADIWSLGITALELAKGTAPYASLTPMEVLVKTLREDPPTLASYPDVAGAAKPTFSKNFHKFLELCLQKDPAKRADATALLNSKFIKNAKQAHLTDVLARAPALRAVGDSDPAAEEAGYVPGTTWYFPDDDLEESSTAGGGTGAGAGTGVAPKSSNVEDASRLLSVDADMDDKLDDDDGDGGDAAPTAAVVSGGGAASDAAAGTAAPSTAAAAATPEAAAPAPAPAPPVKDTSVMDIGQLKGLIETGVGDDHDDPVDDDDDAS